MLPWLIIAGILLWTLRDEFRRGRSLNYRGEFLAACEPDVDDLYDGELPDGWDPWDVLRTYDDIRSL